MINSTLVSLAVMLTALHSSANLNLPYSKSCLQYVGSFLNETKQRQQQLIKYLKVSGHGLNQLGRYYDCLELPNSTYFTSFLAYQQQQLPVFVGFCFTDQCSASDINQLIGFMHIPIGFADLKEPSKWEAQTDATTYVSIGLLVLLAVMCIAGTLMTAYYSKRSGSGALPKFLHHFSLQRSLGNLRNKPEQLRYLNGVRAISFISVVFGHQLFLRYNLSENYLTMSLQLGKAYVVYVFSYIFCVDVFFLLGGFLVGMLFLKVYMRRPSGMLFFAKALLQRVLRFWPVFILTILLYWKIVPLLGSGPLYYTVEGIVKSCEQTYWSDLLFFTNFRHVTYCLGWTWYVNVDMQLFVVSLMLLAVYVSRWKHSRKVAWLLGVLLTLLTIIYIFIQCQTHNYQVYSAADDNPQNDLDYQAYIYLKPWSRAAPYLLGLFSGIAYYHYQEAIRNAHKVKLHAIYSWRIVRLASTIVGLSLVFFYISAPYNLLNGKSEWSQVEHSLYLATGHFGFTFGMLLMLLPMLLGYSNPIQTFLEVEPLQLIAKLSFSSYMIHFVVLVRMSCNIKSSQYTNPWSVFIYACSDIVIVLGCGFLVFVTTESPFASLLDAAFGKSKPQQKGILEEK